MLRFFSTRLSYWYLSPSHFTWSLLISPHSAFKSAAVFIPTVNCRQQNTPTEFGEPNQALGLCRYWYCVFHSRECREREPFLRNSKDFSLKPWQFETRRQHRDDFDDCLKQQNLHNGYCCLKRVNQKDALCTNQKLQRKEGWEGAAPQAASTGTHLPEPGPAQVSAGWSEPQPLTHQQLPGPQARQGPLADPGGRAALCEARTTPDWRCLEQFARPGQTWCLHWGFYPRLPPAPSLCPPLLFPSLLGPWPAQRGYCSSSLQGEELKTSPTESGQGLDSNQPLSSSPKHWLRSWAHDTHLDAALCDGHHRFGQDLSSLS